MAASVVVELRALAKEMKRFARLSHPTALRAMRDEAVTLVALGFRASKAPDGTPWAPLKVRQGQPLRDTGRLMASITTGRAARITKRGFTLGTNVEYAGHHQTGTKKRDGSERMPARPFLPEPGALPPDWARSLEEAAEEALEALVKK